MLQGEHSAILSTYMYIKLPFVIKIFVLSIFEWPFYMGFTVSIITRGAQWLSGYWYSVRLEIDGSLIGDSLVAVLCP